MKRFVAIFLGTLIWSNVAQAQTTIYWKKDHIRDASGAAIAVATPAPTDTTAPNAPGSPQETAKTTTSITLSWTDSNESDLAGFLIYRDAVPVGAVGATTNGFTDLGLRPYTIYNYRVVSFDSSYNYSGFSSTLNVRTEAGPPTNLLATASSTTQINLTWTGVGGHHFGIWRRSSGSYSKIGTSSSSSYSDTTASASTAYLYKVSAEDASDGVLGWSGVDLATTVMFTDDTITVGSTVMKAAHVTELRTAVNAVRAAASLSAATWTNSSLSGAWIQAVDVSELRTTLGDAISALDLTAPTYTDSTLTNTTTIKKVHIEQLRQRVK
jgi:hypothetical protein